MSRLDQADCKRVINLSPNSFSTSEPLAVRCAIIERFFYELASFCSNSCNLLSQFLVDKLAVSVIFSIVSPNLTSYMNNTVIFYLSLADCTSDDYWLLFSLATAFSTLISFVWNYCCLLISFSCYLNPAISDENIIELSTLGTYFITKFYNQFNLTIIFVYKFVFLSS